MALSLPVLSCKVMDRPVTSWTPKPVIVTLSSTTLMVVLAKIASDSGENTCDKHQKQYINVGASACISLAGQVLVHELQSKSEGNNPISPRV